MGVCSPPSLSFSSSSEIGIVVGSSIGSVSGASISEGLPLNEMAIAITPNSPRPAVVPTITKNMV